jgi:16S rRNA (guanine966-N2)-methyltransferase
VRVIAGSARGTRLGPVPAGVRPLSDRAREGLFASLGSDVPDARCLDLFAGTGAVGIEALSRGAVSCTFVDASREAADAVRSNLERAHLAERGTVRTADVAVYLRRRRADEPPYELVFLDPPYELAEPPLSACLAALDAGWLAPEGWTLVLTRGHKSSLPTVPVHWATRRQLRYGDSLLTLYREDRWA